jgi:hypothetical protein
MKCVLVCFLAILSFLVGGAREIYVNYSPLIIRLFSRTKQLRRLFGPFSADPTSRLRF